MKPLWTILLLALFAGLSIGQDPLVLVNVNVVMPHEGKVLRNQTVEIKNGIIISVTDSSQAPQGRPVINANGQFLIPGLWDMHAHTSFISPQWDEKIIYPLYIANGITGVRDMGGDFELLKQRRAKIEKGELLGPHLYISGPFLIDAEPDAQTISVKNPKDARDAVDKLKNENVDFIKILSRLSRASYFAIADESKKKHIHFVGHVPSTISALEASTAGQYSIEHLTGISLACSSQETDLQAKIKIATASRDWFAYRALYEQAVWSYDNQKATTLFSAFVKNNTWQVPTLIWTKTQSALEDAKWDTDPRLKYVPASVRQEWDRKVLLKQTPPDILANYKNEASGGPKLVKEMFKAGVRFMAGSDGPDPYVFPGSSLHDELELLVQSGFTPAQALEAATTNPAILMQKTDKYGAIEAGHAADLVLLEANPLEDIHNTRKIAAVILGGKYYPRAELDKMLSQVESLAK
ncbi:MAG TPA: amidohydrolase family protein [Terriglobales bacterium]|nr:amidohydrolase family protein [Terriglobales bacterium]